MTTRRTGGWPDDAHLHELHRLAKDTPAIQLAISLMADAGCRLREALSFDVSSLSDRGLRIYATKTRRWRSVPVPVRLSRAIAAAVMQQSATGRAQLLPYSPRTIQRHLINLCYAADTPLTTPHRLRHSYATRLHAEGIPLATISALMGHKSLAATLGYLHVGDTDYDLARRALDRRARRHRPRRRPKR